MATFTLQASLPDLLFSEGMILRLEAIDPSTGLAVAGVKASEWAIYGQDVRAVDAGPVQALPPLLTYGPGG